METLRNSVDTRCSTIVIYETYTSASRLKYSTLNTPLPPLYKGRQPPGFECNDYFNTIIRVLGKMVRSFFLKKRSTTEYNDYTCVHGFSSSTPFMLFDYVREVDSPAAVTILS